MKVAEQEATENATLEALEKESTAQAKHPPTTIDEWNAHVISGVGPAVVYFYERTNIDTGDRWDICEFFCGSRVFDPFFAATTISENDGRGLIDKMAIYPVLSAGEPSLITRMKKSWCAYR